MPLPFSGIISLSLSISFHTLLLIIYAFSLPPFLPPQGKPGQFVFLLRPGGGGVNVFFVFPSPTPLACWVQSCLSTPTNALAWPPPREPRRVDLVVDKVDQLAHVGALVQRRALLFAEEGGLVGAEARAAHLAHYFLYKYI